jgi:ATP-dependent Clp protease, protease subunit
MPNFRIRAAGKKKIEIYLYDTIGEDWWGGISAKAFAAELKSAGANVDKIVLRVNSAGGDVFDGLAIYNELVRHPARVEADIDGMAASIASIVVMAAEEIRIADNAMMMIHDPWTGAVGSAQDLRDKAALLDQVGGNLVRTYAARTGRKEEQLKDWMAAETWFDARQAVDQGFATRITEPQRAAASSRVDVPWFRHVPHAVRRASAAHASSESALTVMADAKLAGMRQRLEGVRA